MASAVQLCLGTGSGFLLFIAFWGRLVSVGGRQYFGDCQEVFVGDGVLWTICECFGCLYFGVGMCMYSSLCLWHSQ